MNLVLLNDSDLFSNECDSEDAFKLAVESSIEAISLAGVRDSSGS